MQTKRLWWLAVAGLMCVVLGAGCKTKPAIGEGMGEGADFLSPEVWDTPLSERFEEGTRVTGVEFDKVLFAYDSFQIADSETAKIERVADYMRRNSDVRLVLEGHCDERGSREYNMSLGENRALAVRAYLLGLSISSPRMQTRSYGEERAVDPGHDERAWRTNRRVEFVLFR